MIGSAIPGFVLNILFRADLSPWVEGRSINICFIGNPGAKGVLAKLPRPNLWYFQASHPQAEAPSRADVTPEHCREIVRKAIGVEALELEIIRAAPWGSAARYAEHYSQGRVFIAGDAAHEIPVAGGFAMNTGIQDAHNLTWKLAAVIKGFAAPALLESYACEREPVGKQVVDETLRNLLSVRTGGQSSGIGAGPKEAAPPLPRGRPEFFNELGLIFGATYGRGAVVPDGSPEPQLLNPVTDYRPAARPGNRAPHAWFRRSGQRVCTTDLLGPFMLLLAGEKGEPWCAAAKEMARSCGLVRSHTVARIGDLVAENSSWREVFGIEPDGAVLIRPDGYVSWRSRAMVSDPREGLSDVLTRILRNPTV